MNELDMSAPGSELFPDAAQAQYNSYLDVNQDQVVADPIGVTPEVANQGQLSDKEFNFRALREETAKLQQEASYWKGQAEAYSKSRQPESAQSTPQDAYSALDMQDSSDVRKAFDAIRQDNVRLREEFKDAITAIETKTTHQDWNSMVTQHVPQLTSKNPIFAEMIKNASNPYEAAYLLAELNSRASQPAQQPTQHNGNGQRAIFNAAKPQSLASVGGQGQLSSADYYASMSDKDFMEVAGKNLANI